MLISRLLRITPGITALIGGGGKTTLMYTLAEELSETGTVIVSTSTRILAPRHLPVLTGDSKEEIGAQLNEKRIVCVGKNADRRKLSAPSIPFPELSALADYVIVEADGAHRLPIKAHADYEPVIPSETNQAVLVIGADSFGRPISEICHRPERFAAIAGVSVHAVVSSEIIKRVIKREHLGDCLFINKVEDSEAEKNARLLSALLEMPVIAGSLMKGEYRCLR